MFRLEKNRRLRERYEQIYSGQLQNFYTFDTLHERMAIYEECPWRGKKVLEIGCGEGELAQLIAWSGANVTAIDYVADAIKICREHYDNVPNLEFINCSFEGFEGCYDVVVMQGVLEHMDDPLAVLQFIKSNLLTESGEIITSSPSFLNARGYIWMALQYLFDIPMSLTDVCFLCPFDFETFAERLNMKLKYTTIDQDWGCGQRLIIDFKKRLVNACRDKGLEADVDKFIHWLEKAVRYPSTSEFSGALAIYHFYPQKP